MEKQRKWQLFLILAVTALTLYNILPTLFYYSKPLHQPIEEAQGEKIALNISKRVNHLEEDATDWVRSFCKLLQIQPISIQIDPSQPQFLTVSFVKTEEASKFRTFLPRSGSLIPFNPAQLSLSSQKLDGKEVIVQRKIPVRFDAPKDFFAFAKKGDPLYTQILIDRASQVALALSGPSDAAHLLNSLQHGASASSYVESLAAQINAISQVFGADSSIGNRFAARLTQGVASDKEQAIQALIHAFDQLRDQIRAAPEKTAQLQQLESRTLSAENQLKKHPSLFSKSADPWTLSQIETQLAKNLSLPLKNPLFSHLVLDLEKETLSLRWHPDVAPFRKDAPNKERFEQLIIDEIAKIQHLTGEIVSQEGENVSIALTELSNTSSFLALKLERIGALQAEQIRTLLKTEWRATHPDLKSLLIVDAKEYQALPLEQKTLALVVYSPLSHGEEPFPGLQNQSIYVVAKGIDRILQNYQEFPDSELAQLFSREFQDLAKILHQNGFLGYRGSFYPGAFSLANDFVFEKRDFYTPLLAASRENFTVRGTKKYALLELSDSEQRILTENKIETKIHEDLLKWNDEYRAAQVSLHSLTRLDIPEPTKSVFWSNLSLSARKLFRGDERKIIRWGLDLSGGKSVQIELCDTNGKPVTGDAEIKQGINELHNRVNKMGVSEVSIRRLGNQVVLDFPGSQALSASQLIQSSTMHFHVVNEKFSPHHSALSESVNRFLQEVWNEAVVTGKRDPQSVHAIAWRHLHGADLRSDAAQTLWEQGLRFASPHDFSTSNAVDDSLSRVALFRGADYGEWHGQTNPLLIIFNNWALEGAYLENIRAGYDPSKGNFLSFEVQGTTTTRDSQKIHPRNDLFAWTSRFSKEKVSGTPNEAYSRGNGWRMAVLLNETIISAPTLDSPLRESASISGSFSQREVNQLAADLKAGSLTFTPRILSEKNVSPELGKSDRLQGITATIVALLLVIGSMVAYYRFAGIVASAAVLFNLLIIWATLQNLGATLTLAGLAGIILTVAMAVDANVLVFERVKEEFAATGRIASAIQAGYKKAYSAIIDSNVTTLIAALILLNFDAGPIKSFSVNLIIGIVSSMFTALFMTRYYFTGWLQNPKNKSLAMSNWIEGTRFDFLKWAKPAFAVALAIIIGGGAFVYFERGSIFGMDFTGGYALELEVPATGNELLSVENALHKAGASAQDVQVRELKPSNHLRVLLGTTMEQKGKPFYQLPLETTPESVAYSYETNPRIAWVVHALNGVGITPTPATLAQIDANWTAMSGQMSDSMRTNALIGLLISFVCIFVYLAFRFEYKFAAAALICLFHDVLITLGLMGLLHYFGVPVQIDLNTVAALMTIVGYSLNDTIIIFDRIREEMKMKKGTPLSAIVNHSLNITLSRTSITSGTTLLVLLALVVLGGSSIFSFALVMAMGVFFGTLSSWFIASPLMLLFHNREEAKEREMVQQN